MKRSLLMLVAATTLLAQGNNGIPPRKSATDFPAHETANGNTLAGALLTPAEAKKLFSADLDRAGYMVFEVAMYPANDRQVEISPDQFTLRSGSSGSILPTVSPDAICDSMFKGKHSPIPKLPEAVDVHTATTIGYETGGGRGRPGGVYTGTSTTVGIDPRASGKGGPPPPPNTTGKADRDIVFAELTAREFPNTRATKPVSGYLYFAKPESKPKTGMYEITCTLMGLSGENIVLSVQAPAKR